VGIWCRSPEAREENAAAEAPISEVARLKM